jgi:hypothetical protein
MRLTAIVVAALAVPLSVWAQESNNGWGGRAFVNVNIGAQTSSPDFGYNYSTRLFGENARAGLDIPGRNGVAFDVGGGVRLIQNLGVGLTYSRYSNERTATLSTTIPSPLFYGDFSTVERTLPLQREEDAVHIQAMYRIPVTSKMQLGVFGGPTYFRCLDDVVSGFALQGAVSPSFDWSVNFRDVTQTVEKDTAWGYHGGLDVTYMVLRHVGLGATVRYSHSSHTTTNPFSATQDLFNYGTWGGENGSETVKMEHGGLHWNGGVSFRF